MMNLLQKKMKNILVLFAYIFLLKSISLSQLSLIDNSIKYLKENNSSPQAYIIDKFSNTDIILLAEDHRVKENLDFLGSLIPQLYKNGIFTIGMEFGAYEDQKLLDSLVTAETYNENLARQLMFNYNPGWAFKEYMEIYRCAWAYNQTLTKNERKFRILNLSYKYNWATFSGQIDTLFLNEANWQEAFKNIPDPDWHPKPNSLAAYWEQIYNFADVVKYYEKTDVE